MSDWDHAALHSGRLGRGDKAPLQTPSKPLSSRERGLFTMQAAGTELMEGRGGGGGRPGGKGKRLATNCHTRE